MAGQGIRVVGVGNELRGDDAVGIVVARLVARRQLPGVVVHEIGDDTSAVIDILRGAAAAYLIDAMRSGLAPGASRRFDLRHGRLPPGFPLSSHLIGLGQAIELARALDALPPTLVVHGIEGERFDPGEPLSPRVSAAAAEVAEQLVAEIDTLRTGAGARHA